ncbi:MAG TPA: DUF4349 domain-containing protein [Gaiellaceae bacterium]|nr:DUF4349 domain-containing protein [Gaiellaceae bacterium]
MSQPELLEQIRTARVPAPPELRARVRALASAVPPPPPRRRFAARRTAFVVVPAAVALAIAGALVAGLADSGRTKRAEPAPVAQPLARDAATAREKAAGSGAAGSIPATPGRAQRYESELTLKVANLSAATRRALRLTRSYRGYVRSVEYGSGTQRGNAYLVVRVPVGRVQEAIVSFSALGEIVDQHTSIEDVQPAVDRRFRQMQAIRDLIAKLQARLENPALTGDERRALEDRLVAERRRLVVLQKEQSALLRQTSFATVSLSLRSAKQAAAAPHRPGRIERALDRSGSVLLDELKVALYVLVVGAPLLVVVALSLAGSRLWRRRVDARLLSR